MADRPYEKVRTREATPFRIFFLVASLGSLEFFINAASLYLPRIATTAIWTFAGWIAILGSVGFERLKLRQNRWRQE